MENCNQTDREMLLSLLPEGWREAAKCKGALTRRRQIKTAEELLHLNLLYLTEAGSYQGASILMMATEDIRINKEAVRKRIQNSGEWMRWMSREMNVDKGYMAAKKPEWLGERRPLLIDASDVALRGSGTSNYRLHYAFDLFGYTCAQMELTEISNGGEKLDRYAAKPGDIFIGDRAYGTVNAMEHIRLNGASFVLRMKTGAFGLYDDKGERLELLPQLRTLAEWESLALHCFYKDGKGTPHPIRVTVIRKDEDTVVRASNKLARTATRKKRAFVGKKTQEMTGYIVLVTNLSDTKEQILELYRARCVFYS